MKKLFTLIGLLIMSVGMFAQEAKFNLVLQSTVGETVSLMYQYGVADEGYCIDEPQADVLAAGEDPGEAELYFEEDGILILQVQEGCAYDIIGIYQNGVDITKSCIEFSPGKAYIVQGIEAEDYIGILMGESATPKVRDNTLKVFVSGKDKYQGSLKIQFNNPATAEDMPTIDTSSDYAEILFDDEQDLPMSFNFSGILDSQYEYKLYLNDNPVEYVDAYHGFNCADGDVLHIIFDYKTKQSVTLGTSGMSSFVSHNDLTFAEEGDVKAYAATSIDGNKVRLSQVTGKVAANTPLMLVGEAGATVTIPHAAAEDEEAEIGTNLLVPFWIGNLLKETSYIFGTDNDVTGFWQQTNTEYMNITGDHAKLAIPSSAKALTISFDEATSINAVESAEQQGAAFNLAGQKVSDSFRGIVIKKGKKYIK